MDSSVSINNQELNSPNNGSQKDSPTFNPSAQKKNFNNTNTYEKLPIVAQVHDPSCISPSNLLSELKVSLLIFINCVLQNFCNFLN